MDSTTVLVGLVSHAPGSGKTTIARLLEVGHGFIRHPFAGPLKELATNLLLMAGVDQPEAERFIYRDKEEIIPRLNVTGRWLMQSLGTDWGRKLIHDEIWLDCWRHRYDGWAPESPCFGGPLLVVVDDVRFPNEAETIRSLGGQVWEIVRPGAQRPHGPTRRVVAWLPRRLQRLLPDRLRYRPHASEGGLRGYPNFHRTIVNDGTVDDLRALLHNIALGGFRGESAPSVTHSRGFAALSPAAKEGSHA